MILALSITISQVLHPCDQRQMLPGTTSPPYHCTNACYLKGLAVTSQPDFYMCFEQEQGLQFHWIGSFLILPCASMTGSHELLFSLSMVSGGLIKISSTTCERKGLLTSPIMLDV